MAAEEDRIKYVYIVTCFGGYGSARVLSLPLSLFPFTTGATAITVEIRLYDSGKGEVGNVK